MLQNFSVEIKYHRWWDWSHRGTKYYKMSLWEKIPPLLHCSCRPAGAAGAAPCHHSNIDISARSPNLWKPPLSAWSCRSRQPHSRLSGQQRPRNSRLRPQSQRIALSSALLAALTISKRPASSRRRPFGVPSPCGKNGQENCRFPWDWQPRRPPASPQAAGKRARSRHQALHRASARARTRARPAPPITSPHTSTTSLTPLVQLTSAHALLALHHARDFALRRAPAVLLRPSPLGRLVHPCPHNSSPCAGPFTPYTRADPAGAPAWRLPGASGPPAFSCFGCVGPGAIVTTPP